MTDPTPEPIQGSALPESPAEMQKRQLADARAEALRKSQEIKAAEQSLRAEVEAKMAEMRAELAARTAELEARMAPLLEEVKRLEEGIWTVNLYLGRDEEIVSLRDNENLVPADADTPLVIRQEVLSMDEETAAHAESGGIDARDIETFDAWVKNPVNLDRVLPERRGVVALVPRRRDRIYGDPWTQVKMDEENKWTYFLIRNGERLYRMRTDFVVGKRLVPATDEFTGLFVDRNGNPLTPGTTDWDDAERRQGARERHYMRMALILQGLVDRTTVFHPLPAIGVNLLDPRTYDEGRAVMLRDAEALLTDGRPGFYEWLADKTNDLRVGMRVMGAFNTDTFRKAGGEHGGEYWSPNDRLTPRPANKWSGQERPVTGALYRLEGKKTERGVTGFVFKYERTSKGWYRDKWGNEEYRAPRTKASCLVAPGDRFILPFDLVTVEECRYYLDARTHRYAYEEMFPLLHACIAAKEAEAQEEAPFRDLLARALVAADPDIDATDPGLAEAHAILDPLVHWWKVGNKYHRALTGDDATVADKQSHEAKAIAQIVTEHLARKGALAATAGDTDAEAAMVRRMLDPNRGGDPSIMVIARKRDGGYLAFAPQPRKYPAAHETGLPATNVVQPEWTEADEAALNARHPVHRPDQAEQASKIPAAVRDNVWAVEYTTTKTGRTLQSREWVQPGSRLDTLRILHTSADWETWDLHADPNEHLTDPEIDTAIAEFLPDIENAARTGWPSPHRINAAPEDPFEPLVLGVCLRTDPGDYDSRPRFEVHLSHADEPEGLDAAPSAVANNRITSRAWTVHVHFSKSRNGFAIQRDERTGMFHLRERTGSATYSGTSNARPWHYFWSGRARHAIALVEYPDNQRIVTERESRIAAHNATVNDLRSKATATLQWAKDAADAAVEAAEYARFLDDYRDPSLWEGHRKTLREGALKADWNSSGHDVPDEVVKTLYRAADAGMVTSTKEPYGDHGYMRTCHHIPGHTIGSLLEFFAVSPASDRIGEFLDLPLHGETPEAIETVDDR